MVVNNRVADLYNSLVSEISNLISGLFKLP